MKTRIAILLCLVGMLAFASTAIAASPQTDTYGAVEGVAGVSATPKAPHPSPHPTVVTPGGVEQSSGASLPFTGSDALLFGGVGALLLGTGLAMRRANRSGF